MRIGIDARLYTQTGVGRYIRNLISELGTLNNDNEYFIYLKKDEFDRFNSPDKKFKKKLLNISWHTVEEQILLPRVLLKDHLDVAHFPYFNVPVLYPKKFLLTIHDLIVDHFDTGRASTLPSVLYKIKRFGYKLSLRSGIQKASAITAISETTKREIMDHYSVKENKIIITYDALDEKFKNRLKSQKKIRYYPFPYLLYVGNAYPHKNLERLISAFTLLTDQYKSLKLVMAGDDRFFYPRLKHIADQKNISDKIIFFGEANDIQLINLYSYAECLVFPSLMEGFGLPNLESIACGKLPVISNISVFKEIWGNEMIMFDPEDHHDMAEKIRLNLCLSQIDYLKKVKILQKKVDKFSWHNTALKTLNLYKQIFQSE